MAKKNGAKKLRVGWFTFTCCEDNTILFMEILNDHFFDWKDKIDFLYMKALKSKNKITNYDVCFVEGAIASEDEKEMLKKLRGLSTVLVATGECAVSGNFSAQRNKFDESVTEKYKEVMERFEYTKKVQALKDIVKVDANLPGCPMNPDECVALFEKMFKQFGVE